MAQPNPPSMRPPWLDLGRRPERLTPTSAVLVVLAMVVVGGGIVAAAMRGTAPSTLLRPTPTLRPTSAAARNGFPQSVTCTPGTEGWTCVPGKPGGQRYTLLAVREDASSSPGRMFTVVGPVSTQTPSRDVPAPRALVCVDELVQLTCDSKSLPPTPGLSRAVYVRAR
jgi:hypothetical protein